LTRLAIDGGAPVRTEPFPAYRVIGEPEKAAVAEVMESGILSRFIGGWHQDFFGGPQVQAFEQEWAAACGARHAVSVNSATSGLYAACGAAGVGAGDEVIVSPYTMSASCVAPMVYNATPVFADINPETYCLDPESIRARITPNTKAIVVVHIFGMAADMDPIMELAAAHDLVVIEDCAQSPFATYKGRPVGTLGHMGVFSFNYHKHIHTGEGGMITTNDDRFAERCQLIRNHAEAVVAGKGVSDLTNMIGFNYRMGEIEAAIGLCQLAKGPGLIDARKKNVAYLEAGLAGLPGLSMPTTEPAGDHVYYVHALGYDPDETGVPSSVLVDALKAELPVTELREGEGPLVRAGYVQPVYNLPIFQARSDFYPPGLCPVTEAANQRLLIHEFMRPPMREADLDDVIAAFTKVLGNLSMLRTIGQRKTST
jgi:perosamine synthetase